MGIEYGLVCVLVFFRIKVVKVVLAFVYFRFDRCVTEVYQPPFVLSRETHRFANVRGNPSGMCYS